MVRSDLGLRRVPSREVATALGVESATIPAADRGWTGPTAPAARGPRGTTAIPAYARPVETPPVRRGASRIGPADGSGWPAERRRRRTGRLLAVLFVLVLAGSAGGAAWWFGTGRFVAVPPLAGLSQAQVTDRIGTAGLKATFTGEASPTVATGRVVRSDPGAGDRVLRGRTVTVVLSTGRPPVPVPVVTGQDEQAAVGAVQRAGLSPQVTEQSSVEVEEGQVVSQDPAGGSLPPGSAVRLVVSTGPAVVAVPEVRGLSIGDAQQKLKDFGFQVRVRSLRIGDVIAQSPSAGTERRQGSTVTIYGL